MLPVTAITCNHLERQCNQPAAHWNPADMQPSLQPPCTRSRQSHIHTRPGITCTSHTLWTGAQHGFKIATIQFNLNEVIQMSNYCSHVGHHMMCFYMSALRRVSCIVYTEGFYWSQVPLFTFLSDILPCVQDLFKGVWCLDIIRTSFSLSISFSELLKPYCIIASEPLPLFCETLQKKEERLKALNQTN